MNTIRWKALVFPPLGLLLLWRSRVGLGRKILGTIGLLLYSLLYLVILAAVLHWGFGLEFEMRGRPIPVPTFSKNVPDFRALEESRKQQSASTVTQSDGGVYWTDFRGPRRDGKYDESPVATNWPPTGLPVLWRQPIGGGYASFVIAHGHAFTLEQRRDREAVTAYDSATGRELWAHTYPAFFQEWMGGDGPRGTPTYAEDHLYTLGAVGDLHCLLAEDGKVQWHRNILQDLQCSNLMYGTAISPLVAKGKVIVTAGQGFTAMSRTVAAYDQQSGELRWSVLTNKMAYVSPVLAQLAGVEQILIVGGTHVFGLNPGDGKLLWQQPWPVAYDNNIAQPLLVGTNRFFVSSGYGAGCALFEVARAGDAFSLRTVWKNKYLKNKFTSSVLWDNHIYGLDEDILTCLDVETGARRWKDGRYGHGQMIVSQGHLIILAGDGQLALVRANSAAHEELARFPALKGKTWNHPALADGRLFVRNSAEMACYQITLLNLLVR